MTREQRENSLVAARRACLYLMEFAVSESVFLMGEAHRLPMACLVEEFMRMDAKERKQMDHVRAIAKKAGRPPGKLKKSGKKGIKKAR